MGRFPGICSVVLGLCLLSCAHPQVSARNPQVLTESPLVPVPVTLTVHVDDAFPLEERNLLEAAAVALNVQTHGLVTIRTISGLDTTSFWVPPGDWRLMRILESSDLTHRFDMRNAKGAPEPIVGICVRADRNLYVVPDRIRTEEQFVSVTMHELLHAVGLEHTVAAPRSVMSAVLPSRAPVVLTVIDQEELLRALTPRPASVSQ